MKPLYTGALIATFTIFTACGGGGSSSGGGNSGSGTSNQQPVADDQTLNVDEGNSLTITLTGSDADGDTLTFSVTAQPGNGTLSGTAPNLTYTPDSGYQGSDSIRFVVNDGTEDSVAGTIDITVNASTIVRRDLNDTGIKTAGTTSTRNNMLTCGTTSYSSPGSSVSEIIRYPQDCDQGRDDTHDDDSDGRSGFSYTKLDDGGNDLAASATQADDDWECTRDEVTGLVWEVKEVANPNSPRYYDNTFTWFSSDVSESGGDSGTANGGICTGTAVDCDTESYVNYVNNTLPGGLCGFDDGWRMPTRAELLSIHDFGDQNGVGIGFTTPAIDLVYFPNTMNGATQTGIYWTGSTHAASLDEAWRANFGVHDGIQPVGKNFSLRVRLVHD